MAFSCPACSTPMSCKETRHTAQGTRRRYTCPRCGHRAATLEVLGEIAGRKSKGMRPMKSLDAEPIRTAAQAILVAMERMLEPVKALERLAGKTTEE